ncbi:efflux RND transporter periplasmic adaptor subunit [Burkholderia ubonensis]|uniref:efflux RND transporter periplasmic adaptor subunit n=1 Tax=Burkholderia ubonensis TaxID=101571 RepID=UPI00075CDF50|nr:efflux RND transporter periplasmic adaptor subunit [Burkholderia ubonensis]KVT04120.1 RND transporter MFP subunit [Burkholderia ubonensis]KVT09611.1 RND transporter MFP subunit [Burkholderia ubonensis]KVT28262.1 RND transporter MFP subunit [Burkholderia ubonensis]
MKSPGLDARTSTRPFLTRIAPPLRRAPIAFACCAILLTACHSHEAPAPELQPVVALPVHADNGAVQRVLPAQVQARYSTPLSFRVGGKIVERRVRIGDAVKAGQALAMLDPADLRNTLLNARAQLDAAEHRVVYAKQQLDRDRAQAQANLIAPAQLETTQDAYASAVAQRDSALAQIGLAEDHLRYATLVADHDGVITSEDADTGQNVEPGQAVFHLDWSGDLDIVCDVSERDLRDLSVGRTAHVSLTALPGKVLDARVREVAAAADPQSRTWRVKLTLLSPGPDVRSGMTASVTFDGAAAAADRAITLPATALFHRGEAPAVWVVRKGSDTLELRPVTVGRYDERTVTVTSGLADEDCVVMQGVHTVSAGQHVRVVPPLHAEDFTS